jgi:sugar fermentation stimulation protein A
MLLEVPNALLEVPYALPLQEGILLARRDRFLADIRLLTGQEVVCHCYNPGRCEGFVQSGLRVWVQPAAENDPQKVCTTTWLLQTEEDDEGVGNNTREIEKHGPVRNAAGTRVTYGTWEICEIEGGVMCSVNTVRPNYLVHALLTSRRLPGLDFIELLPEHNLPLELPASAQGKKPTVSRCDFLIRDEEGDHWVEVKSCNIVNPDGYRILTTP